jgi:CheY-like chemotaxis protein
VIRKVLIVDDSKLARMAAKKSLQSLYADWLSAEASNADEALAYVQASSPDFVLLDFNMPGKDGIAFAAELRDLHPNICVAVISANRQTEVINRARETGATFLAKPLTEQALREFLDTTIQQQATR